MRRPGPGTDAGTVPQIDPETVIGVLVGIGALLYVMAVLDPTSTPKPSHRADRRRVEP